VSISLAHSKGKGSNVTNFYKPFIIFVSFLAFDIAYR